MDIEQLAREDYHEPNARLYKGALEMQTARVRELEPIVRELAQFTDVADFRCDSVVALAKQAKKAMEGR